MLLEPLTEALRRTVMTSTILHGDDTPVPVLAPGTGKTKTGRLWAYVRDPRGHGGTDPPAVIYQYSPDRKAIHPQTHLKDFTGWLHADGYPGFEALYLKKPDGSVRIIEVSCWAHARRKFHDLMISHKYSIAEEALARIAKLYAIENEIRGRPPDERRRVRQERAMPLLTALKAWLKKSLAQLSQKSALAKAINYVLGRWTALTRYVDDGRLEIDNTIVERAIRCLAVGRKNWLFAGSDDGGARAAMVFSLIETAKLNDVEPHAYLVDVLTRIADHPINRIHELLPWAWAATGSHETPQKAAA